jgi:DNA-binding NarL/FixJ family response regulator
MDGYSYRQCISDANLNCVVEQTLPLDSAPLAGSSVAFIAVKAENLGAAIASLRSALPSGSHIFLSKEGKRHATSSQDHVATISTSRQLEVLLLLKQNLSNKEIGRRLNLSHFTVRNHVSQILRMFNVSSRKDVVRLLTQVAEC